MVTSINQAFFQVWFPSKVLQLWYTVQPPVGSRVTWWPNESPQNLRWELLWTLPPSCKSPKRWFSWESATKPNSDYLTGPGQNPSNYCIVISIFLGFFYTLLFICHGHFTKIPGKKEKTHFESLLDEMRTRQMHKFNKLMEQYYFLVVCVLGQVRNAKNKGKNNNKKEQSQEK